jgi:nuclear pore complex protein Nup98-Nup96
MRTQVENLTVGREGFGQIQFLEPVDVRGLDLNQLIVIEQHLINVFPDDATKPVRGQGINVPARITIEGAWPAKRDAKSVEEYEAFLRKKGSRRKQRFVDYDRQRGAWTFDVPGF